MNYLLLGAGNDRRRKVCLDGVGTFPCPPVTLDINEDCRPDVVHDLNVLPYPFPDNAFDEIHAYEVLEHCGSQGDWRYFFRQFDELWRMLKPGGTFHFTVPAPSSPWAWGDPGHTRIFHVNSLGFLQRKNYRNCETTPMTDYRRVFVGDWEIVASYQNEDTLFGILKAL